MTKDRQQAPDKARRGWRGPTVARFLGQAAIWGSSFTLIKIALDAVSPSQLVVARLVLGAVALAIVALASGVSLRMRPNAWAHVALSAVFANVAPYLLLSWGEQRASAGLAGVLVGGTPLVTVLIATVALRDERATGRRMVGFVVGFVGVVLVFAPWSAVASSTAGAIACLLAAVSYAIGYVYVRRFISPLSVQPIALATNQIAGAAVMLAISPAFPWHPLARVSVGVVLAVVVLGELSTGLANILYFRLIQDVGASTAAAVDYLVPVFAVGIGALVLDESVPWHSIAGGIVVLSGMALAAGRRHRDVRER